MHGVFLFINFDQTTNIMGSIIEALIEMGGAALETGLIENDNSRGKRGGCSIWFVVALILFLTAAGVVFLKSK